MFIKIFLIDHYKVPTGSMTPTLLGGMVATIDLNRDGQRDLIYWERLGRPPSIFLKENGQYLFTESVPPPSQELVQAWISEGKVRRWVDHILVNRFAYWFRQPTRGDIVIFTVPSEIFRPEAPVYVKRLVGMPGEIVTFGPEGELRVDGVPVDSPDFFRTQRYQPVISSRAEGYEIQEEIEYSYPSATQRQIRRIEVLPSEAYVLGDNTYGSLDSRYWGGVPLENFKGRAFMRIYPFNHSGFLR